MNELFEEQKGHLTDYALGALAADRLDDLARLEIAEHLAFCDHCLERYTALLDAGPLLEAPDLFAPSVLRALRKKMARVMVSRYFTVGVSACIALVLWVTGVFSLPTVRRQENQAKPNLEQSVRPPFSITRAAGDTLDSWAGGLSDFFNSIDLRGVFTSEKK